MSIQSHIESIVGEYNKKDIEMEERFRIFHDAELGKARKQGRDDGLNGKPTLNLSELSLFEKEIYSSYQQYVDENAGLSKKYMIQLHEKYFIKFIKEEKARNPQKTARKLKALEEDRKEELAELDRQEENKIQEIETRPAIAEKEKNLTRARRQYNNLATQEKYQTAPVTLPSGIYWVIFIVGAIGEVLINSTVLEVFGESYWNTVIFALFLGILIAGSGHFAGLLFRKEKNKWAPSLISLAVIFVALGVAYYRTVYLEGLELGVDTNWQLNWLFFALVPTLAYFIVTVASYLHANPHSYFSEIKQNYLKSKKEYEDLLEGLHNEKQTVRENYDKIRKEINEKYEVKEYNIEDEEDIIRGLIQEIIAHYNVVLNEGKALEKLINNSCKETIHTYRDFNKSVRQEEKMPEVWSQPPPDLDFQIRMESPLTDLPSKPTSLN